MELIFLSSVADRTPCYICLLHSIQEKSCLKWIYPRQQPDELRLRLQSLCIVTWDEIAFSSVGFFPEQHLKDPVASEYRYKL